jgi:hypothetical protein
MGALGYPLQPDGCVSKRIGQNIFIYLQYNTGGPSPFLGRNFQYFMTWNFMILPSICAKKYTLQRIFYFFAQWPSFAKFVQQIPASSQNIKGFV